MGGVDVERVEGRKGYPHNAETNQRGGGWRRTERDIHGRRGTLSSAAFDHLCSRHLRYVLQGCFFPLFVAVVIFQVCLFVSRLMTLITCTYLMPENGMTKS